MISIFVLPGESEILPTAVPIFFDPPLKYFKLALTTGILKVGLPQLQGGPLCLCHTTELGLY